ncbi:Bcr/CflA family efflux MFS transporter [Komagataeibacter sp. FXV3]|uniref:Bcr/CflA family efflux MFS transporter n=1 Tax=Komagataeibacter sp. FXV3 TaxID=2608998 RepID=UPI00187BBA80|nr:Bcr/CflA family efflux MFS transporter [Komagataeibacter sp. FXV3]MBE7731307.1 multidrug effflux MFS transporter [Komagataeibacter sp. FXV3]
MTAISSGSPPAAQDRQLTGTTLFLLAGLAALGTLSTNIILPAFPAISASFGTSAQSLSATLSAFFIAFAIGQLVVGPLSDRIGRHWLVVGGLVLFCAGSLVCAAAPSLHVLVLGRTVQALGACATSVLSRAIARDLFDGPALAKALAMTMIAMAAAPGFSPLLGGLLNSIAGWRWTFVLVGLCGLFLAAFFSLNQGETHPADRRRAHTLGQVASGYMQLASDRQFVLPGLPVSLLIGSLYTYFAAAPAILMRGAGLDAFQLGIFFAATVFMVFAAGFLAPRLAQRCGQTTTVLLGFAVALLGSLILFVAPYASPLPVITVSWLTFLLGLGVANPVATAVTLHPFSARAGLASALLGFLQMALAAVGTAATSALPYTSTTSLGLVLSAAIAFGLIVFLPVALHRRA